MSIEEIVRKNGLHRPGLSEESRALARKIIDLIAAVSVEVQKAGVGLERKVVFGALSHASAVMILSQADDVEHAKAVSNTHAAKVAATVARSLDPVAPLPELIERLSQVEW